MHMVLNIIHVLIEKSSVIQGPYRNNAAVSLLQGGLIMQFYCHFLTALKLEDNILWVFGPASKGQIQKPRKEICCLIKP
jgi:hypothetical protein